MIVAQSSEQGEGKISVLLNMAHAVGKKLIGGSPISALTPATASPAATLSPGQGLPLAGKPAQGERAPQGGERKAPVGADAGDPAPQGPVTLTVLSQYDPNGDTGKAWRELMDAFRAKYPDITIEEQNIKDGGLYGKQLESRLKSGKAPDIMKLDMGARFDPALPAMDLEPFLRGRGELFLPSVRRLMSGPRGLYFLPESVVPTHVFYANKRLLKKLGLPPPESLEALIAQQPQIKKAGLVGIAMSDKDGWQAQSTLLSALASRSGGNGWVHRAVRKEGASFRDPAFVEAIDAIKRLADAKLFPPNILTIDYGAPLDMFNSGKAVYMIDGAWRYSGINPDLDVMASTLPGMGRDGGPGIASASVSGYGMNAALSGEKARAAWLWLWFFFGPEGAKIRFRHGGALQSPIDPRIFTDGIQGRLAQYYDFMREVELDDIIDARMDAQAVNEGLKQLIAGKKKPVAVAEDIERWAEKNLPERKR